MLFSCGTPPVASMMFNIAAAPSGGCACPFTISPGRSPARRSCSPASAKSQISRSTGQAWAGGVVESGSEVGAEATVPVKLGDAGFLPPEQPVARKSTKKTAMIAVPQIRGDRQQWPIFEQRRAVLCCCATARSSSGHGVPRLHATARGSSGDGVPVPTRTGGAFGPVCRSRPPWRKA